MRKINKGLLLCAVLFLTVIFGMSVYASYPDIQMKCYLNKKDYVKAVKLYNDNFADAEEADIYQELFLGEIKEIKATWKEGKVTYRAAELLLSTIEAVEHKSVAMEAKKIKEFILIEGLAKECYSNAETYLAKEKYVDALKEIAKIDESYLEYSKVEKLQENCVNAILEQTKSLDSVEEYENWIRKLGSYHKIVPEAAFLTRKAQLEQEVVVLRDVIDILKKVADFYGQDAYKAAFSTLGAGVDKYPDNGKVQEAYNYYHADYVSKITDAVEELCEQKAYKNALEIAENAKEIHDCDEFLQLAEYVKEEKNILYKWKNDIVDFFDKLRK